MISPDNKYKLIIDEEEAELVRRIYNMAANGMSYYRISNTFYKEKMPTLVAYAFARTGRRHRGCDNARMCCWSLNAVRAILSNPVCLGNMVNDRTAAFDRHLMPHALVEHARFPMWSWDLISK
ncbi:MAG: recombinase family protein [Oscillospiraceae bacterium]|nr:recombinase family protein [Oscillospiraceae bacterium]